MTIVCKCHLKYVIWIMFSVARAHLYMHMDSIAKLKELQHNYNMQIDIRSNILTTNVNFVERKWIVPLVYESHCR